jgi:hypothetical protein
MVSSLQPPRFTLNLLDKDGRNSLHAKGWIGDKSCIVTIARPDITAELPERSDHEARPTDGIKRDPSHLGGSISDIDSAAAPTNDLGICRRNIQRVHPGTLHNVHPRCICGLQGPRGTTGQWGSAIAAPWDATAFIRCMKGNWCSSNSIR